MAAWSLSPIAALLLLAAASAFRVPAPSAPGRPAVRAHAPRLVASTPLRDDDIINALADEKYAMDISSITTGSELETYIGQGSGVNEGAGIGKLAGWVKGAVGRYLAWKNRPVYEELWKIIEDDLLGLSLIHISEPTRPY